MESSFKARAYLAIVVAGNYIGTDATGTLDRGNTIDGIRIEGGATNNTIGGTNANQRNVISGNDARGIVIQGSGTNSNIVRGNYIGTNAAGTAATGQYRFRHRRLERSAKQHDRGQYCRCWERDLRKW
jgi:hypothetical protein